MGWKGRILAASAGAVLLGAGGWVFALPLFAYLFLSFVPTGRSSSPGGGARGARFPFRYALAGVLATLSAVAFASGGETSGWLLLGFGGAVVGWPLVSRSLPLGEMLPVAGTILVRSKYVPFNWAGVAEVKPGTDPFPRLVSSFSGSLLVFTETGRTFAVSRCRALVREEAEDKVLEELRSASPRSGALLLPLDADGASKVLGHRFTRRRRGTRQGGVGDGPRAAQGVLALEVRNERVGRLTSFEVVPGSGALNLPRALDRAEGEPLTWEVFESLGKWVRWPEADALSELLGSMTATRGAPVSERLAELGTSGGGVKVKSLSGEVLEMSRPQLRAVLSVYS